MYLHSKDADVMQQSGYRCQYFHCGAPAERCLCLSQFYQYQQKQVLRPKMSVYETRLFFFQYMFEVFKFVRYEYMKVSDSPR
jgi:hypothetical protein